MNTFVKILLACTLFISCASAIQKDQIKDVMTNKIDKSLLVLRNSELDSQQKVDELVKILDEVFDYELMAKVSLGKVTWKSISEEQQNEFVKAFEKKLKTSYMDKLNLYTDQEVKIVDLITYKKSRLQLQTEVIGKDETYKIDYNFYNNKKKNEWYIYDVNLLGVSIIQTYRKQFSGLLKEKTFDEMLDVLKNNKN